jgi:NitT/TauT family transport system permease protein
LNPRKLRLGFILAATGMLSALILPLSSEVATALPARPATLVLTLLAALLFVIAAWIGGIIAVAAGLSGAVGGAVVALALLRDPAIAGSAAAGFWMIVIAAWLAAALCVMELASLRFRDKFAQRVLSLSIPLLFGAVVFYLWEVLVRGFGVPPVLMPPPSKAAARFISSLPILGGDFVQTFIRGVLIGYIIGCGAGLLVRRCRWSAWRRSWSCGSASTGRLRPPSWRW